MNADGDRVGGSNLGPSVLFSGYFGCGNAGDEAVLEASIGLLRARRPDLGVAVLSANPSDTAARYGVRSYPRMEPRAVVRALRETDLLLSGGGSLLQDRTSLRSLIYYLGVIRLALALRRPVMVFAQGIGPLARPAARRMTGALLRRVALIAVRDRESAVLLEELGVRGPGAPEIQVTADPAFALEPEETARVDGILRPMQRPGGPLVAVSLRSWPGMAQAAEAIHEGLAAALPGARVLACPFQPGEDGAICASFVRSMGEAACLVDEPLRPREWRALLGHVDLVVAARLHALILAAAAGTPTVAIAYDPKVAALQKRLDEPNLGPPNGVTAAAVAQAAGAARENREGEAARRRAVAGELRRHATRNAELALGLLARQRVPPADREVSRC